MVELLGWLGILLFIATLARFVLRCLRWSNAARATIRRYHHILAVASFVILTVHGIFALFEETIWQWGKAMRHQGELLTGLISWLVLLALVSLSTTAAKKGLLSRKHGWLVGLLVVAVFIHIT
ncbi:MAG: hypothetical protein A4E53_02943 [Pelotomaculum sp. PtaB.Bin104]|nr:MAG: hypothetical protein A4E53_02943 [Pelotomaculum sp. PtaB.Bin104]